MNLREKMKPSLSGNETTTSQTTMLNLRGNWEKKKPSLFEANQNPGNATMNHAFRAFLWISPFNPSPFSLPLQVITATGRGLRWPLALHTFAQAVPMGW